MFNLAKKVLKRLPLLKQIKRSVFDWKADPKKDVKFFRKNINKIKFLFQNSSLMQKLIFYCGHQSVLIDISGICNAKCLYCCQGSGNHKSKTAFMTAKHFEQIIDHLLNLQILGQDNNTVALINWGEPFLNHDFDNILSVLKKNDLKCGVSSNFIKEPEISDGNYGVIRDVCLSICSLKPDRYKRIYGADLEKVLNNFDKFLSKQRLYSPQTNVKVNWIKYKFNADEFEYSKKFFTNKLFANSVKTDASYARNADKTHTSPPPRSFSALFVRRLLRLYKRRIRFSKYISIGKNNRLR
ncbi:MAG: hypothetical protein LBH29_03680 [Elusimicrobiota bacterium]|jgi:MoaA/NifB/PqqE/SkfB family radical SAM enzyme|nr:hypothetical protein [Elusimicrobiota bacterium]